MFHFILKLVLWGVIGVGAMLLLLHVFPGVIAILAVIGLVKLYHLFRGPKPPGFWR